MLPFLFSCRSSVGCGPAKAELACGEAKAARATIEEGLAIATENKEPIHIAQSRTMRGRTALGKLNRRA